jgi:peptide/nickel transport system ATP-binding protein
MSTSVLKVSGLTTHFETKAGIAKAVNDVSFSVEQGQILALVGESGSGKSVTAMSLMNLVDPPGRVVAGEILLRGKDIRAASSAEWNRIRGKEMAMVFQDPMMSLNPVIRVGDQITETIRIHDKVSASAARERACAALAAVGIPAPAERMRAYPHELSGGMRQRIAIANAIVNEPAVIIADEPTTALDVTIQAQILYQIRKLTKERGTGLVWITHDLSVVKDLADEVCVMYAGRIVEKGAVADVIRSPRHPYTRGLIDSLPKSQDRGSLLKPIRGSTPPLLDLPPGCAFAPRCNRATEACAKTPGQIQTDDRSFLCFHPLFTADTL